MIFSHSLREVTTDQAAFSPALGSRTAPVEDASFGIFRTFSHTPRARWFLRYAVSYRDLEEMMRDRGLGVDHTTIYRWVQRYAPEIDKRCRPFLRRTNDSYRIDETS